jgi:hypothetical protein
LDEDSLLIRCDGIRFVPQRFLSDAQVDPGESVIRILGQNLPQNGKGATCFTLHCVGYCEIRASGRVTRFFDGCNSLIGPAGSDERAA